MYRSKLGEIRTSTEIAHINVSGVQSELTRLLKIWSPADNPDYEHVLNVLETVDLLIESSISALYSDWTDS